MKTALLLAAAILLPVAASARTVDVRMLDNAPGGGPGFDPAIVHIAPGDTVRFVAADAGHKVQSISGMLPVGATPFSGEMSKDLSVTFDKPGLYGFDCAPHYFIGMVGVVVVGDRHNEAAAKAVSQPGMAKDAFATIFKKLDAEAP